MAIPKYQTIMLPLLKLLEDKKEHSLRETIDILANQFNLTQEERRRLLPSGQMAVFKNRVGWARTYMKKADLIEYTKRGYFRITGRGIYVLKTNPPKIDVKLLEQFDEFKEFTAVKHTKPRKKLEEFTPGEALETAYQNIRNELADEIIKRLKAISPSLFENIVVDLITKMGYGGSREDAVAAIGGTGDEGVDGIINEDRLGLDVIYIQAKRWEGTIGRPEIQKFVGALQGKRSKKGIFITTSNFSREAKDYASNIETKVVLIDGKTLVQHMIDYNIGVNPSSIFELKKIDLDYFTE
jgi:restriction system protein